MTDFRASLGPPKPHGIPSWWVGHPREGFLDRAWREWSRMAGSKEGQQSQRRYESTDLSVPKKASPNRSAYHQEDSAA